MSFVGCQNEQKKEERLIHSGLKTDHRRRELQHQLQHGPAKIKAITCWMNRRLITRYKKITSSSSTMKFLKDILRVVIIHIYITALVQVFVIQMYNSEWLQRFKIMQSITIALWNKYCPHSGKLSSSVGEVLYFHLFLSWFCMLLLLECPVRSWHHQLTTFNHLYWAASFCHRETRRLSHSIETLQSSQICFILNMSTSQFEIHIFANLRWHVNF